MDEGEEAADEKEVDADDGGEIMRGAGCGEDEELEEEEERVPTGWKRCGRAWT